MEYVIGIDSGGTKYRVLARALDGTVLGEHEGVGASHYSLPLDELSRRINLNIDACLAVFGGRREDCVFLVCGTTGLDSEEDGQLLHEMYSGLAGFSCPMECINDGELAFYTVTGGYGALVISGTGSIAFGRNRNGETARAGGWLFSIMGDEGSGTWVARKALRQLGRWFDGVIPDGPMLRLIRESLGIKTRKELMDYSARIAASSLKPSGLGRLVDEAAAQGDSLALGILEAAALETFGLVGDLISRLGMEDDEGLKIGIWGSNILNSPSHQAAFRRETAARYPQAEVILPTRSALEGAADMALERYQSGKPVK